MGFRDQPRGTEWIRPTCGATGARAVVLQQGADEYVKRPYDMRVREVAEAAGNSASPHLDRNQIVVCHPDGSATPRNNKRRAGPC